MLTWHQDRSGYWLGRTRAGHEVADIHPRRLREPYRWVVGAKTGTAATVQFAQKRAEEAYLEQHHEVH
jgi:hypothetical protein